MAISGMLKSEGEGGDDVAGMAVTDVVPDMADDVVIAVWDAAIQKQVIWNAAMQRHCYMGGYINKGHI